MQISHRVHKFCGQAIEKPVITQSFLFDYQETFDLLSIPFSV